jgi:ABC-type transport system substrate-binding protein
MVRDAGYPNGFKTKITCQDLAADKSVSLAAADMMAEFGVKAEVEPQTPQQFLPNLRNGKTAPMAFDTMVGGAPNPWLLGSILWDSIRSFVDPELEDLYWKQSMAWTVDAQNAAIKAMHKGMWDKAFAIFLYHPALLWVVANGIDWKAPPSGGVIELQTAKYV